MSMKNPIKWFSKRNENCHEPAPKDVFEQLLRGIQTTWKIDDFEGGCCYTFKFQGGYFKGSISDDSMLVHIAFPFIATLSIEHLHTLRQICNNYNYTTRFTKVLYVQTEDNPELLALHLESSIRLSHYTEELQRDFEGILSVCFRDLHKLRYQLDEIENGNNEDNEEENISKNAENALMQMLEETAIGSEFSLKNPLNDTERYTIGSVICQILQADSMEDVGFQELSIVTERLDHINTAEKIRNFRIVSLLTRIDFIDPQTALEADSDKPMRFVRSEATAIVHVSSSDRGTQSVVLHLSAERETSDELYIRLTIVCPEKAISPEYSLDNRAEREPKNYSFLISLPTKTCEQQHQEFEYRLQEAKNIQEQGGSLSKEQLLLLRCNEADVQYNVFRGYRCLVRKDYPNAIRHLENAFFFLHKKGISLSEQEHRVFLDICLFIGISYMNLRMLEKAQYYLDFITDEQSFGYVLVRARNMRMLHDPRLLSYINKKYGELQDLLQKRKEKEPPQPLIRYKHFLMMMHVRVFADEGDFDNAMRWAEALHYEGHENPILEKLTDYLKTKIGKNDDNSEEIRKKWEELYNRLCEEEDDDALNFDI